MRIYKAFNRICCASLPKNYRSLLDEDLKAGKSLVAPCSIGSAYNLGATSET